MPYALRQSRRSAWTVALLCCCLVELCGCSLFVMAGKMLQGDPVIESEFKAYYGKSMENSGKKVAVMCSTPESVKSEFSSLDLDLSADISRKLSLHKVSVIQNHRVASWIDDHGGGEVSLKELGGEIEADLVMKVTLDHFDFREENSPDLFRGKARGSVVVYELVRENESSLKFESKPKSDSEKENDKDTKSGKKRDRSKPQLKVLSVREVYSTTFDTTYPPLQPISITQMQPETFRKKFLDRIGDEISRLFYRHKPGTDI